jgi:rare lipoprotein A
MGLSLVACESNQSSRYSQKQDSAPQFRYGELELEDAVPRYEPYAPANSRPYTVFGEYYTPMFTGKGFVEEGGASWYGQKFHGHLTSNGEIYDMFEMTAAHKTLPLPSFVKVTNLDNNRTTIVRVNDRGPFHPDRVIDLSYAAAKKLDVIAHGVANVKIEVIHIDENGVMTVGNGAPQQPDVPPSIAAPSHRRTALASAPSEPMSAEDNMVELAPARALSPGLRAIEAPRLDELFVQVGAFSNQEAVIELSEGLSRLYQVPADTPLIDNVYRLRLGPLKNEQKAEKLIKELKNIGFDNAFPLVVPAD